MTLSWGIFNEALIDLIGCGSEIPMQLAAERRQEWRLELEILTIEQLREKVRTLPAAPGVYLMKDKSGTVIYVGKAKKLKNRVTSYFQDSQNHTAKTRLLVSHIVNFDYIIARTEFEALVLECSLIKHYQPKYNILLKDDKGYPYIRLDQRVEYPVFSMASKVQKDGAIYFGPYGSRSVTSAAIETLKKTFQLPTCTRVFPRDIGKERPCLNYQIGNCAGWCRGEPDAEEYRRRIDQGMMVLNGKDRELCRELREEMLAASEQLNFEKAAEYRNRYQAIEALSHRQMVVSGAAADTDVIGFYQGTAKTCFTVIHYIHGNLMDKDLRVIESGPDEPQQEVLSALLKQYYVARSCAPKRILLPFSIDDAELFSQFLLEQYGCKTSIQVPQRGDNVRLITIANENAKEEAERVSTDSERRSKTLELLQKMIGLDREIRRIEAFDISNLGDQDIVASMTVHVDGKPLKKDYKRFKLRNLSGQDDYASMEQVVKRRYTRLIDCDSGFDRAPDLILIDGGAVHAGIAKKVITELELDIPVLGMVKDDRHRTRALIHDNGEEIGIQQSQPVFSLIGMIQEETHRFAITYQRELRSKTSQASVLDRIPGIGPERKKKLFKHFKSMKNIKAASVEELAAVIPRNAALAVYDYFMKENIQKDADES